MRDTGDMRGGGGRGEGTLVTHHSSEFSLFPRQFSENLVFLTVLLRLRGGEEEVRGKAHRREKMKEEVKDGGREEWEGRERN